MIVFRFPFLANEIFNCEINALLDRFFDAPEKLKKSKSEPTPTTVDIKKDKDGDDSSSEEEPAEKEEELKSQS